jgi:mannose-6-phosphate isomerase-like protein (cupin superfamily)
MGAKDWEKLLRQAGFTHTYVWEDGPGVFYPDHTHSTETAHIVLEGDMPVTCGGGTKTYKIGERFDVPAHTVHAAKMGPRGCRYFIGEK